MRNKGGTKDLKSGPAPHFWFFDIIFINFDMFQNIFYLLIYVLFSCNPAKFRSILGYLRLNLEILKKLT